jgi:hypothetical protein
MAVAPDSTLGGSAWPRGSLAPFRRLALPALLVQGADFQNLYQWPGGWGPLAGNKSIVDRSQPAEYRAAAKLPSFSLSLSQTVLGGREGPDTKDRRIPFTELVRATPERKDTNDATQDDPLLALLPLLLLAAACDQSNVKKGAVAADWLSLAVKNFGEAEIIAHQQGLIDDSEHVAINKALIDFGNAGKQLDDAIRAAQSKTTVNDALKRALDTFSALLDEGVFHIKNPQARQSLGAILLAAKGFLVTIAAVIQT